MKRTCLLSLIGLISLISWSTVSADFLPNYNPSNNDYYAYWVDSEGTTWRSADGCARTVNDKSYHNDINVALSCDDAVVIETDWRTRLVVTGGWVNFDFDSATLDSRAVSSVDALIKTIGPGVDVEISLLGHTDAVGPSDYNMDLGYRRAAAVAARLAAAGIDSEIASAGETELLVDSEGRVRRNRRVDVDASWAIRGSEVVRGNP